MVSPNSELVYIAINELRSLKAQPPFDPSADIDMVWVVSSPGTVKEISTDGEYAGRSFDLDVVTGGIELVKKVTAKRLGKPTTEVTRDDIASHGPTLYYNGEDSDTEGSVYHQNEHLSEMASQPGFPIPPSKLKIRPIPRLGTHTQVEELAQYLRQDPLAPHVGKIAVVSNAPHCTRVGRYIQHHKALFPEGVDFVNAPVPVTHNPVAITLREVRKVAHYATKGDLARESIFHSKSKKQ